MKLITAPAEAKSFERSLFLGGGITDCPDWQSEVIDMLSDTDLTLINPRRNSWDMRADQSESIKQINWEDWHLRHSEYIMFWFPCETLCPITLFELGKYLMTDKKLFIGTHPDYKRRLDVIIQTGHVRNYNIHNSLESLVHDIRQNT